MSSAMSKKDDDHDPENPEDEGEIPDTTQDEPGDEDSMASDMVMYHNNLLLQARTVKIRIDWVNFGFRSHIILACCHQAYFANKKSLPSNLRENLACGCHHS